MSYEEFKSRWINFVNWGWIGEFGEYLLNKSNSDKEMKKIYNRASKFADRHCLSFSDGLIAIVERGKV